MIQKGRRPDWKGALRGDQEIRVLIVEGDEKERESLSYLVTVAARRCNFNGKVTTFNVGNQKSALSLINSVAVTFEFAFIAIQCNPLNPQKDGYKIVARLRDEMLLTGVIFMTTRTPKTERIYDEIIASGADEYLESPVDLQKLQKNMERFFN